MSPKDKWEPRLFKYNKKLEKWIIQGIIQRPTRDSKEGILKNSVPINTLQTKVKDLKEALDMLLTPTCNDLHHSKKDQHEFNEPCPVKKRFAELIGE